jgi:hypothetical protein
VNSFSETEAFVQTRFRIQGWDRLGTEAVRRRPGKRNWPTGSVDGLMWVTMWQHPTAADGTVLYGSGVRFADFQAIVSRDGAGRGRDLLHARVSRDLARKRHALRITLGYLLSLSL